MKPMVVMAARAASMVGQDLLRFHRNRQNMDLQVSNKGIDGPVTQLDQHAERRLVEILKKSYPKHSFLGEEFGELRGQGDDAEWCWIIDPLDGTQNFVHGFAHFCISIAVQHKGVTQHGIVYDPVRDELFSASRGEGAFISRGLDPAHPDTLIDQRRLRISGRDQLDGSLLAVGHPPATLRDGQVIRHARAHFDSLLAVTEAGAHIRRSGSAALDLAYVAAGRFDGFFELNLKSWDIAAGELLVREAGGTVADARGGNDSLRNGQVLACSMKLLKPLMQTVLPHWKGILGQG